MGVQSKRTFSAYCGTMPGAVAQFSRFYAGTAEGCLRIHDHAPSLSPRHGRGPPPGEPDAARHGGSVYGAEHARGRPLGAAEARVVLVGVLEPSSSSLGSTAWSSVRSTAQAAGEDRPELAHPAADRLVKASEHAGKRTSGERSGRKSGRASQDTDPGHSLRSITNAARRRRQCSWRSRRQWEYPAAVAHSEVRARPGPSRSTLSCPPREQR